MICFAGRSTSWLKASPTAMRPGLHSCTRRSFEPHARKIAPAIVARNGAPEMSGRTFGGATAHPKAKGIWRDDERRGTLEDAAEHGTRLPLVSRPNGKEGSLRQCPLSREAQ
jgi:hypothetical protein